MRVKIQLFLFLLFTHLAGFAQSPAIQNTLDRLKKEDKLSDWIYTRIDYAVAHPQEPPGFLMQTQQAVWRKAATSEEHYAWVSLLSTQGYYQLLDGNILGSINSYENAYAYYLKNKVAEFDIVEYTIKPLSNNYTRLGDYERALYLQLRAVKYLNQVKDKPGNIAAVYSNIAISYRSMGNLKAAENSIKKGLQLVNDDDPVSIILNNIHADILYDKNQLPEAAQRIEQNIRKQKNIHAGNAYWLMGAYTTAGNIYKALGRLSLAEKYYTQALHLLNTYYPGARLREKANLLTRLGAIKLLGKQAPAAMHYFNQTLSTLKILHPAGTIDSLKIYGDNMLVDVFQEMASAALQLDKPVDACRYIKLALLSGDKIRNEFADDITKERLQANLKHITEKGIEITLRLYQRTKDQKRLNEILELAEQSKSRTLLDQINRNRFLAGTNQQDSLFIRKNNLERAIIYHERQVMEGNLPVNITAVGKLKYDLALINKKIRQKYPELNTVNDGLSVERALAAQSAKTIEYFAGKDAIYRIDIHQGKVLNVKRIAQADTLRSLIQYYVSTYFKDGPAAMMNAPERFYQKSFQIYRLLLDGEHFEPGQAVVIIPDDVLGYLSFDGLITDARYRPDISSWPFFIKKTQVTYAFSLQTLNRQKAPAAAGGFTGFFITHEQEGKKALHAVADEAKAIKTMIRGNFIMNDQVNTAALNRAFSQSSVLHIGTHAYLSEKNQEPVLDLGREKLFLFELSAKKQAPALVVLTACQTADGLLSAGEGIISLSRGFNAIGTSATIAGLWKVNDVAASVIMGHFYKHMLDGKKNGEALHRAKTDWLNTPQDNNALYLPYYWDNLIYMGTDQQLVLTKAVSGHLVLLLIAGGMVLTLAAFFIYRRRRRP